MLYSSIQQTLDIYLFGFMLIQGIKRGRTIELLEDIDIADGARVTIEVRDRSFFAGELRSVSGGESPPKPGNLWEAIVQWRSTIDWDEWDDEDPWEDVRDRSPGREFSWDE